MPLPSFQSIRVRRREVPDEKKKPSTSANGVVDENSRSEVTQSPDSQDQHGHEYNPTVNIKRATRTRRNAIIVSQVLFVLSIPFLLLTIIGNINDKPVINSTYFFKLDLSDVYPVAFGSEDLILVNSIARSLGLHDFYQVGLWSYCEGYLDEGITFCSKPQNFYWFNPIAIILNELLAGATIALPADIKLYLYLIKTASNLMFGFFMTGIVMNFIFVFITPFALYSRWWSFPLAVFTFFSVLFITAASIIATVMFSIIKNVLTSQAGLNIRAGLGVPMLAFMWISTGATIGGHLIHLCLSCCCASRRDVKTGRKMGSKLAYGEASPVPVGAEEQKSLWRRKWVGKKADDGKNR